MAAPARRRPALRLPAPRRLLRDPAFWYVTVLASMWPLLTLLPAERVAALRAWASTDLGNLRPWPDGHPVESLVVSAFVPQDTIWVWPVFALSVFAVVGALGGRRAVAVLAGVQVLATVITEGLVRWRIEHGALPPEAAHYVDTGPSYVVVAALAVAIGRARPVWSRAVWLAMLAVAAPSLFGGVADGEVAAVGHLISLVAGLAVAAAHRLGLPPVARRLRPAERAPAAGTVGTAGTANDPEGRPERVPSR
ncbi:rhomboid-like protein [Kitasatospora sp. NPDC056327]|uniref:rhomboid-like protein n=1 Tax=Kitasatospora sp. NPDC056327 TaxID=3345785 RepID=UPI0035DEE753